MEIIQEKDKTLCRVEGCFNRRTKMAYNKYRGVCERHRRERNGRISEHTKSHKGKMKELSSTPCYKCGWDFSYTDRHRIAPGSKGGQYTKDNTRSVCPNCHRIETYAHLTLSKNEADRKRLGPNYELCSFVGCLNRALITEDKRQKKMCSVHKKVQEKEVPSSKNTAIFRRREVQKELLNLLIAAETQGLNAVKTRLELLLSDEDPGESLHP